MKRKILLSTLTCLVILSSTTPSAFSASNAPGSKCTKVGATAKSGTVKVKCVKSGSKLIWQKVTPTGPTKSAAALCVVGNPCAVGTKGTGGGIVFYDAGSSQSWGRYLEAAPPGWSGPLADPNALWCNVTDKSFFDAVTDPAVKSSLGLEIGKGKANTDVMVAGCTSGAGVLARAYKGGAKTDWYLPSRDELVLMYKNILGIGGFRSGMYWSSSEFGTATNAWEKAMYNDGPSAGIQYGGLKTHTDWVRPIRAF